MAGKIYGKKIDGKTYYYYQESYREKVNPDESGKGKGSGKSKSKTRSFYLGTAEQILQMKQDSKGAASVKYKEYGFAKAAYNSAVETGLVDALKKNIKGKRFGIERWKFFLLTIINRLDNATSKNKMDKWAEKTVLPELMEFDPKKLTSQNYWYVTDDVISEKELQENRKSEEYDKEDIFKGLGDDVFVKIEKDIFNVLQPYFSNFSGSIAYDTTNFFTYIENQTSSDLAKTGHNKASKHHLRQIGMAMAVDIEHGLPFFHRTYAGNKHDSRTFSSVMDDLISSINGTFTGTKELVLIIDKGNNKKETFEHLSGKIDWIGSLTPSHHTDLLEVDLAEYDQSYGNTKAYKTKKEVMGKCYPVIVTYNPSLHNKQNHTLARGLENFKSKLEQKYNSYKKVPILLTKGLENIINSSRYKSLAEVSINENGIVFEINTQRMKERRKRMGKNILFTSKQDAQVSWVIKNYKEKDVIESGFKMMKDYDLVRIQPIRHWTDTKIRSFIFCAVMSYLLMKLMVIKVEEADLKMSAKVLKEELYDLKEVIMIYKDGSAEKKISQMGTVQKQLAALFGIEK